MAKAGSGIGQTKSSTVGKFRVKPNNNILEKERKKISTTKSLILAQDER